MAKDHREISSAHAPKETAQTPEEASILVDEARLAHLSDEAARIEASAQTFVSQVAEEGPAGEEAAREMEVVATEAKELRHTFLRRLGEILRAPARAIERYQEEKSAEQLAIPDNEKIRKEIDEMLAELRQRIHKAASEKKRILQKTGQEANYIEL